MENETGAAGSGVRQFISFTIGDEEYGVDIMSIREIKGWTATTELPNAPPYMRGVINLRGAIVPILDLRARFGGDRTKAEARHVIIVVSVAQRVVGILVDAVADIITVATNDIQPVPDMEQGEATQYLTGLVAVSGRLVALLDLNHLFVAEFDTAA